MRSAQIVVRCENPDVAALARAQLRERIDAGITHLVAPILAKRPVQWLVDEVIEPVRAAS